MKHIEIAIMRNDFLAFPVLYDHLISWVVPITDVVKVKTIFCSKVAHFSFCVKEISMIVRFFRIANFFFSFKKGGIENTFIFKPWIKLFEALIDNTKWQMGEQ